MKLSTILFLMLPILFYGQEKLEIQGAIILENSEQETPVPGTIRWTGIDFQGWNGLTWVSLTGGAEVGTVMDLDGNEYKTIKIGNQIWMAQNLKTTVYNDDEVIDQITNETTWQNLTQGAWCNHSNIEANDQIYGKLYNWYAVQTGKLCPDEWSVPSNADFIQLSDYLGGTDLAGGKLKQAGTELWTDPNVGATNETGFTALPGGNRANGSFNGLGNDATFWSSDIDPMDSNKAKDLYMPHTSDNVGHFSGQKWFGYSVRCLKD